LIFGDNHASTHPCRGARCCLFFAVNKPGGKPPRAGPGDYLTLDPPGPKGGPTIAASSYVYEPLVEYDQDFNLVPALAVSWEQPEPTKWVFQLRDGVSFHDGAPFSAEDVVFSIQRAMAPTSNFKAYVNGIKDVKALDDLTVEIETEGPNPVLLRQL